MTNRVVLEQSSEQYFVLTDNDRRMLKLLVIPDGHVSPKEIARQANLPTSTVHRRRQKLLTDGIITLQYHLQVYKFGWRRVDFLIQVFNGKVNAITETLIEQKEITTVYKTIGQHTIDIRAEAILKGNSDLLMLLERIKEIDGVQEVMWSEAVEVIGKKATVPAQVIDKL